MLNNNCLGRCLFGFSHLEFCYRKYLSKQINVSNKIVHFWFLSVLLLLLGVYGGKSNRKVFNYEPFLAVKSCGMLLASYVMLEFYAQSKVQSG